jgi:putative endonuclease
MIDEGGNITKTQDSTRQIGRFGECVVCDYLKKNGYRIKERNFLTKHGEVDIIAEDETCLVFIEVKTRSDTVHLLKYGNPSAAVTGEKLHRIRYAGNEYLRSHKSAKIYRIDVAEVFLLRFTSCSEEFISARIHYMKSAV